MRGWKLYKKHLVFRDSIRGYRHWLYNEGGIKDLFDRGFMDNLEYLEGIELLKEVKSS